MRQDTDPFRLQWRDIVNELRAIAADVNDLSQIKARDTTRAFVRSLAMIFFGLGLVLYALVAGSLSVAAILSSLLFQNLWVYPSLYPPLAATLGVSALVAATLGAFFLRSVAMHHNHQRAMNDAENLENEQEA